MTTPLTLTHLRFDAVARSPIKLGGAQAGERLRDALARVMLRSVCPETHRTEKPTPAHAAVCPVCRLLAAELEPGEVRRPYAVQAPIPARDVVETGESFSFGLTLFGAGFRDLPYYVLAVPEVGWVGVGPGRGQFDLQAIWALNPLKLTVEAVLEPGSQTVKIPSERLDWNQAEEYASSAVRNGQLEIQFLTPTRLVEEGMLVKSPDFGVIFQRLLLRIDQLAQQHCGGERRPPEEIERLHALADQVRLVEAEVEWVDIWGPSNRTGRRTPMGGFTGRAVYRSREWDDLLPYLALGQGAQNGKLAVKGNGVFQVETPGRMGYWDWMMAAQVKRESH